MKNHYFLVLNIGTETAKSLIFKRVGQKLYILARSLQHFDRFGVFESKNFEIDIVKKAVFGAIGESQRQVKVKPSSSFISFPANILKARVIFQSFERKNQKEEIQKREAENIQQIILKEARKKVFQTINQEIQFLTLKILEIKIDGYEVSHLQGFRGKNLDFRILTTFLLKHYAENVEKITQALGLRNLRIINLAENLPEVLDNGKLDGIFLDIGGDLTQIFVISEGRLDKVDEFEIGGKDFLKNLSENLGVSLERAGNLLQNYQNKILSKQVKKRIKEIFVKVAKKWFDSLKSCFKKEDFLPQNIFIFGGGSLIPEIQEVLENGDWSDILFTQKPKIRILYPKDLKNIGDKTGGLNNPQNTFSYLLCKAINISFFSD